MLLSLLACNESNLNKCTPELDVQPDGIDFGEVVVGTQSEIGVGLVNQTCGGITFSDVSLDASTYDFEVLTWPEGELHSGDEAGVLAVRYTPDVEGGDWGEVLLQMDVEGTEPVPVELEGIGVKPCVDIDPETLFFGTVAPGESATMSTRIGASCTGTLRISHIGFAGDEALAYSFSLPADYAEPYPVDHGISFTLDVTFSPPDDAEYRGEIWIESNDPEQETAAVHLIGNSTDDPTLNEAPNVEILDPDNGEYFMDDEAVAFTGSVYDADQPAEELICGWYVGASPLSSGSPDADGTITGSGLLDAGDVLVTLKCFDAEGEVGQDSVTLTVWPHDEPVLYVISGGTSIFDYFAVDDDVSFALNGTTIYADVDRTKTTLPPYSFEANRGDVLTVTAVDQNYCEAVLDGLVLHWGTGESQPLNDPVCESACGGGACNDGSYSGPWPGVFFEEDFTIAIP
ncbi:MAG: hypothetical protein ACOZNI_27600 [Myxococcota bacterium]